MKTNFLLHRKSCVRGFKSLNFRKIKKIKTHCVTFCHDKIKKFNCKLFLRMLNIQSSKNNSLIKQKILKRNLFLRILYKPFKLECKLSNVHISRHTYNGQITYTILYIKSLVIRYSFSCSIYIWSISHTCLPSLGIGNRGQFEILIYCFYVESILQSTESTFFRNGNRLLSRSTLLGKHDGTELPKNTRKTRSRTEPSWKSRVSGISV